MIIFLMAGNTIGGSAFIDVVHVAGFAFNVYMCTRQGKRRQVMVKCGRFPGYIGMTNATILTKTTVVMIILLMTGNTLCTCALINIINMAGFTFHISMRTAQFELHQVVIKSGRLPTLD